MCLHTTSSAFKALRMTPAMAAGLTDHIWDVEEIVTLLEAKEAKEAQAARDAKARQAGDRSQLAPSTRRSPHPDQINGQHITAGNLSDQNQNEPLGTTNRSAGLINSRRS